jgi:hypothetical protein
LDFAGATIRITALRRRQYSQAVQTAKLGKFALN